MSRNESDCAPKFLEIIFALHTTINETANNMFIFLNWIRFPFCNKAKGNTKYNNIIVFDNAGNKDLILNIKELSIVTQ